MDVATSSAPSTRSEGADSRSAVADAYDSVAASGSVDEVQPEGAGAAVEAHGGGQEAQAPEAGERSRDGRGRFAQPEQPAEVDPSAPLKAPQDWTGAAKAHWDRLPREVQAEARRLYAETRKTLDRAAALEKEAAPWREILAPHGDLLAGAGVEAPQVVGELLGMIATLQRGSPQERAALLAHLVRGGLGTDEGSLSLLGQALAGGAPAVETSSAPQPSPEQREAQAQEWARVEGEREGRRAALATWSAFEATRPEFLGEPGFRQRIAAELSVVAHGRLPTHEDIRAAYEAACHSHPAARRILEQREAAERAKRSAGDRARGAAAASGVKNEPAGPVVGKAKSTREEVERQFDKQSRTRI